VGENDPKNVNLRAYTAPTVSSGTKTVTLPDLRIQQNWPLVEIEDTPMRNCP
jgi:hypothetical protein